MDVKKYFPLPKLANLEFQVLARKAAKLTLTKVLVLSKTSILKLCIVNDFLFGLKIILNPGVAKNEMKLCQRRSRKGAL
jgi:hypothetical protein